MARVFSPQVAGAFFGSFHRAESCADFDPRRLTSQIVETCPRMVDTLPRAAEVRTKLGHHTGIVLFVSGMCLLNERSPAGHMTIP